jgi:hypothetical protein
VIWEELQSQGWVDFTAAHQTISSFFAGAGSEVAEGSEADLAATDLVHLTAAEIALPTGLQDALYVPFSLEVPTWAARLAVFSSDCGPFKTHNPRETPRLWDVTLLGSDASKLAWSAGTDSVELVAERFIPVVSRLAEMYARLNERRTDLVEDDPTAWRPEVFAARATLWRAKIGVLLGEENIADALEGVHGEAAGGLPA